MDNKDKHPGGPLPDTDDSGRDDSVHSVHSVPPPDVERGRGAQASQEDFSIYSTSAKRMLCVAVSICCFLSPVTGSIYYPALTQISEDLGVSIDKVNITLTTYFILQGVAPTFVGGFADKSGRRLGYIYCFVVFIASNIGVGAQRNYAALLVLRMVQAAGSSGLVSLSSATVADIVTSEERGQYMAFASLGALLGPALGPVLGGIISQYLGYHWIFWILLIIAVAIFIPTLLFMPETNRRLVGNGSYPPPWPCKSVTSVLQQRRREKLGTAVDPQKVQELHKDYRISLPNPVDSLKMFLDKAALMVLISNGIVIATMYAYFAGIPIWFKANYGYSDVIVGLCYLPFGVANGLGTLLNGRMLDANYRRYARRLGYPLVKNRSVDLTDFPLEKARGEFAIPGLVLGGMCLIAYAWMLEFKVHVAGPLVVSFFMGLSSALSYQSLNLLMIDNFPHKAGAATAANNFSRCLLGALAAGVIQPMFNSMGVGWAYTFWAFVSIGYSPLLLLLMHYGPQLRRQRKEKEAAKEAAKAKKAAAKA